MGKGFTPTEEDLQRILLQFNRLSTLLIDTSSLIRVENAGFLPSLASSLHLITVPAVRAEYVAGSAGIPFPAPVQVLESGLAEGVNRGRSSFKSEDYRRVASLSVDGFLLEIARTHRLPLLSEDRKILQQAELLGLEYYNALMMLEYLLYRGSLSEDAYDASKSILLSQARYGQGVLRYAEALHHYILKWGPLGKG
ncbi:MAG: hypothetical protein N2442_02295 [Spirochaetes bacterium]|nr:hypothetical protein [Spirochaetota bacterium]